MGVLTIRNVDDEVKELLRIRAARHGRSMEAEARVILADTLHKPEESTNFLEALHETFAALGGAELEIPPRNVASHREPPDFSSPEFDRLDTSA